MTLPGEHVYPGIVDDVIPVVDAALARHAGGPDPLLRVRREVQFTILPNPDRPAVVLFVACKGKPLTGPGSNIGIQYEIPNFGADPSDVFKAVQQACSGLRSMKAAQGNGTSL